MKNNTLSLDINLTPTVKYNGRDYRVQSEESQRTSTVRMNFDDKIWWFKINVIYLYCLYKIC